MKRDLASRSQLMCRNDKREKGKVEREKRESTFPFHFHRVRNAFTRIFSILVGINGAKKSINRQTEKDSAADRRIQRAAQKSKRRIQLESSDAAQVVFTHGQSLRFKKWRSRSDSNRRDTGSGAAIRALWLHLAALLREQRNEPARLDVAAGP